MLAEAGRVNRVLWIWLFLPVATILMVFGVVVEVCLIIFVDSG